jgi:class 3 adenylate cyclase
MTVTTKLRRPLFRKYFLALFAAVVIPLLINGTIEAWFGFRDQRALLDVSLRAEASAAADKIQAFLDGIRDQMGWAVQLPWTEESTDAHRVDALRLLRQVPAINDLALIDGAGSERLKVSRVGRDIVDSGIDRSGDPAFIGARREQAWHGPVTLSRGSEPHMLISLAGNRSAVGVAVAQVNLKLIWEVVSSIRVGDSGTAFVIDEHARLVAHPDIDLVLRGADELNTAHLKRLQTLAQESGGRPVTATDVRGRTVLAATAPVAGVDWTVFAERPLAEAYAPIRAALWRTGILVFAGALFAATLAYLLARRMAAPIRLLEEGAERIGAGDFKHRIEISSGDELERLAARFNQMADELALSQERSERIARLKRFLSPQVAQIVESSGGRDLLDARRAHVVVLFCDLRGFTEFSTTVEPEETMRVVDEYYEAVGQAITRYEATLTHFSGDGLMILVNAPVPCADNPVLRAVRMAVEMQAAVQALALTWRARGHAMGFGIGVAMGEATVGRVGYEGRHDYTGIGAVVNLASRLCASAEDGQILLDQAAAAAVTGEIAMTSLGARTLKGFMKPVTAHAVLRDALSG